MRAGWMALVPDLYKLARIIRHTHFKNHTHIKNQCPCPELTELTSGQPK